MVILPSEKRKVEMNDGPRSFSEMSENYHIESQFFFFLMRKVWSYYHEILNGSLFPQPKIKNSCVNDTYPNFRDLKSYALFLKFAQHLSKHRRFWKWIYRWVMGHAIFQEAFHSHDGSVCMPYMVCHLPSTKTPVMLASTINIRIRHGIVAGDFEIGPEISHGHISKIRHGWGCQNMRNGHIPKRLRAVTLAGFLSTSHPNLANFHRYGGFDGLVKPSISIHRNLSRIPMFDCR